MKSALKYCFRVFHEEEPVAKVADITDYLKRRVAEVRLARLVGVTVWASGTIASLVGLLLKHLLLCAVGFPLLFAGLALSVHYEFQLRDYLHTLEDFGRQDK